MDLMTRRTLFTLPVLGLAATAKLNPVRLGGPIFLDSEDPEALAREHKRLGYAAAYCPKVTLQDKERIQAIRSAFQKQGVVISEVGAWVNLLDPDAEKRTKNFTYVAERLALADAVGSLCCVDIAGSYNEKVWYGPHVKNLSKEFFDATVETSRKLIDQVKPSRTKYTVEMMGWNIPDGPDSYLDLIRAIDRKAFGVHIDICNGVNSPRRFYQNADFIRECFSKLGPHIVSCHAKDLEWVAEMNMHFVEVIPGRGSMDYKAYLEEVAKLPQQPPLMLEHLKGAAQYDEGRLHIRKVGDANHIPFA